MQKEGCERNWPLLNLSDGKGRGRTMPKKVFESAKEFNLKPLGLVEILKSKGFNVRNHMSVLSDEDLERIKALLSDKVADPENNKKKTSKKKKTAAKKTQTGEKEKEKEEKEKKKKKAPSVIRRRMAPKTAKPTSSPPGPVATFSSSPTSPSSSKEVKKGGGQKFEEEKIHRFTPVYTPSSTPSVDNTPTPPPDDDHLTQKKDGPKVEKIALSEEKKSQPAPPFPTSTTRDDFSSKKRLGGLASMMSGKKSHLNRSQTLNQTRADHELKSYVALGISGRPIYSQVKRKKAFHGVGEQTEITQVKEAKRVISLHKGGTISEIAQKLGQKVKDLIDRALDIDLLIHPDNYVGILLANKITELYDYRVEDTSFKESDVLDKKEVTKAEKESFPLRDPIITIMGHVDHGKTTLLDTIRKTKVVPEEAGGITQHIGAYSVQMREKSGLTFLDTPGHAAFTAMRQRGTEVTDIAVLVVAADDGVMPQTKESINLCKQANVPMIVAINKVDKKDSNPDRVKQELSELEVLPEDWGGNTQFVHLSALKGEGIDDLLEAIALQAEILELRVNPKGRARGVVIESKIEQGRGPMATILMQSGTLKKGDGLVIGETYGRAKALIDYRGKEILKAGPSTPVQILGPNRPPAPGDLMDVVNSEREAKRIVKNRIDERRELESTPVRPKVSLEDFFAMEKDDSRKTKELNLVVRTDVEGSYEAIKHSLEPLSNSEVTLKIIGGGVGPISDSDINLAFSARGLVIGFNIRPITSAHRLAQDKGVDVKTYSIIYELINDIKLAMEGMLELEFTEEYIGRAEVQEIFSISKVGVIAGSKVIDGKIVVGHHVRLLRQGKIIFDGHISSLRRFKGDVKEVKNGLECGIGLENFNDIKVGDTFEVYQLREYRRKLEEVDKKREGQPGADNSQQQQQQQNQQSLQNRERP